ncbi:unnamed protein product [Paramecium sonneborni]|uniref:Uncharacterized protein n=1 Tax=Paramecium sonneborni TaxID=65129 RepID=A0A8S1NA71_9CILI|nr:unnamed protein product [Paramecium sonneborni]
MNSIQQYPDLEKLTAKIRQVLQKAQVQFNDRQQEIQQGYIEDLRQYCNIVTVCEAQLILSLGEYDLGYLGELIKTLNGFHLVILNNLLLWIQQFQLHLAPHPRSVPFECLIQQSIKEKHKVAKVKQSRASLEMSQIGDFINKLSINSKNIIDSHPSPKEVPQGILIMEQETEKMRDKIKNNQSMLKKLLIMKNKMNQEVQTNMNSFDIMFLQEQNQELKQLIDTTSANYERRIKEEIIKYQEAKIIMKAQKSELDHKISLIEAQGNEISKLKNKRQVNSLIKKFIQIPTIEERNKRFSISQDKNNRSIVFSNQKIRSTSLPRIERSFESFSKKIDLQISKNQIPNQDSKCLYQKLMLPQEQIQFLKACQYVGLQYPPNLFDNQDGGESPKYNQFIKLIQQLKIRHSQCMPKCDHLNFLL